MWEKRLTHYDKDGRVYSSRGYEVALAKLAWFEDREQKRRDTIAAASDINEGLADYKKPDLDTYLND